MSSPAVGALLQSPCASTASDVSLLSRRLPCHCVRAAADDDVELEPDVDVDLTKRGLLPSCILLCYRCACSFPPCPRGTSVSLSRCSILCSSIHKVKKEYLIPFRHAFTALDWQSTNTDHTSSYMDVDSPSSNRSDDDEEFEESGYNAELLELEPLREDSEELRDEDDSKAGQGDGGDGDDDSEDNKQESPGSASSEDQEESDDDDDAHVQGLTANEREILTLLAVDKVELTQYHVMEQLLTLMFSLAETGVSARPRCRCLVSTTTERDTTRSEERR